MDESLPIQVTSEGLFEKGDQSSERLFQKLEAWLNFQTLLANWYQDESLVIKIKLSLMPENVFYGHELDQTLTWQSFENKTLTGVYHHNQSNTEFDSYLMLSKADLNDMMSHPEKVENLFKQKLKFAINELGKHYQCMAI